MSDAGSIGEGRELSDRPLLRELLTVQVDGSGTAVHATVTGELDESTAPSLIDQVGAAIAPDRDVVLDMGGLTFCGSAGLSALITIERTIAEAGGSLAVARPTPFLVQLLEMAGLDGLIADPPAT